MRFATWKVYFPENSNEGITPEVIIRTLGGSADGILHIDESTILGYISENVNLSNFEQYNMLEITEDEALSIALSKNTTAYIDDSGMIKFDPLPKSII